MFILNTIHNFFVWCGYSGFWNFIIAEGLANMYWTMFFIPPAVMIWIVIEKIYGNRIMKFYWYIVRKTKKWQKPGKESDYDKLLIAKKQIKSLKRKIEELELKIPQEQPKETQ